MYLCHNYRYLWSRRLCFYFRGSFGLVSLNVQDRFYYDKMTLFSIFLVAGIVLLLFFLWLRFFADADLLLTLAEKFGKKPAVLRGQVVWLTGASSGIGEALAYELAKAGCRLVLSARRKERLEAVKQKCLTFGPLAEDDCLVLPLDILDQSSHQTATKTVLTHFGQIDILVNNAGRSQRAWAVDTDLQVDKDMVELNIIAQISLTKAVLPHMLSRKSGHIAVTSSLAGKIGIPFSATYCLTKFGINGYFLALSKELYKHNIGVTVVCPGPVKSELTMYAFTGKTGAIYGGNTYQDINRMSAERCAQLMAVGLANKMEEVWISQNSPLLAVYLNQYFPTLTSQFIKMFSHRTIAAREGQ